MTFYLFIINLLSSLSGLLITLGGIWLLYKKKIYIDSTTGRPTVIELPFMIKISANLPVLLFFGIGVSLLIFPIYRSTKAPPRVAISGSLEGNALPIDVYAVVASEKIVSPGRYIIRLSGVSPEVGECKIIYLSGNGKLIAQDFVAIDGNDIALQPKIISLPGGQNSEPSFQTSIAAVDGDAFPDKD